MTPNPPSEPRRSFKAEFKAWLAEKTGRPLRPFPGQAPTALAPVAPAISQEQFTDAQRPVTQQQEIRTRQLMDRICALNNANVTRNYGTHTEDLTRNVQPPSLTIDDLADAKKLLQVLVVGKPGAEPPTKLRLIRPTPTQAAAARRRERDEYTRSSYTPPESCAPFMPDLPSVADVQSQIAAATGYEPPAPDPSPSYDSGGGGDFGGGGASSSWD